MNKLLPTLKKEKPLLKLEEVCEYVQKKFPNKWSNEDIIETLKFGYILSVSLDGLIKGILCYKEIENGHHIFFFASDSRENTRDIIIQGLKNNIWPISAKRKGRYLKYKNTEKLIKRLWEM